jgi:thiol:disulfide interchange protein DsbA
MKRREFCAGMASLGSLATLAGGAGTAAAQASFVEGQHFVRLAQPAPVSVPAGKIEVLEFFSYGCPHCNAFEPSLDAWSKRVPADVVFRRVPVNFLANAEVYQRSYFALEAMGKIDAAQRRIFQAVHGERQRLSSPEAMADLVATVGVDKAQFLSTYKAFAVQNRLLQAKQLVERYRVDGVPALGVHGRYYTSPSLAGGDNPTEVAHTRALAAVDMLIDRVRKGG